jgi:hypothetical protein
MRSPGGVWLALVLVAGCGSEGTTRVLTYNIGNADDQEPNYPLRLSYQSYEDYVAKQIRALDPDIVFLQEVLAPNLCAKFTEGDAARTCFGAGGKAPVERILGDGYSIVCDARLQVECIGVKKTFGSIEGVAAGALSLMGAETPPLPLPACSYAAGECDDTKCDAEATVGAVYVQARGKRLRVVHAHPNAAGINGATSYLGEPCRQAQLQQLFEGLTGSAPAILGGDWNVDLALFASAREKALWEQYVGPGKRFTDLSPLDAQGQFSPTRRIGVATAIDKVLSDAYTGTCKVHGRNMFGADPGQPALDEGYDFSGLPGGAAFTGRIDHLAVSCELR